MTISLFFFCELASVFASYTVHNLVVINVVVTALPVNAHRRFVQHPPISTFDHQLFNHMLYELPNIDLQFNV